MVANEQTAKQTQQLKPNTIQLGTTPSTHQTTSTTTTLELTSLGVDITVLNSLSDLTYAAPSPVNNGYGISTKGLAATDQNCSAISSHPPLGYFFKGTGQFAATNGEQLVRQFAGSYIAWSSPTVDCSTNQAVLTTAAQDRTKLQASFKSIEQIPGD
jgi:hypothetical protein